MLAQCSIPEDLNL